MTARDAATHPDATDEVAAEESATPAAESSESASTESTTATPDAATTAEAADTATSGSTGAAAATEDDAPARGRRRGRRHRHASGDAVESDTTGSDGTASDATDDATPRRRRRTGRLVAVALVVAALFAGAMVALFVVTRPDPIAGLSSSQQSAITAATQAAVNLQTFRRASFDQDFANALASLTPEFAQQQLAPRKDALKQQLESGGRDASATALSAGLVSSTATQAVVLVVTNTTQTADDGTSTPFVFSRLQLTLQYTDGKWLVSDLKSVGLS